MVRTLVFSLLVGLFAAVQAHANPARSLSKCQTTLGKESRGYNDRYSRAIGGCIGRISKQVLETQAEARPASLGRVADACRKSFLNLRNSSAPEKTIAARFVDKVAGACDPDVNPRLAHTAADILGSGDVEESIAPDRLNLWCRSFGGDGSIDELEEWKSCVLNAATCEAKVFLATIYPRMLEWLVALRPALLALDESCGTACASCADPSVADACEVLDDLVATVDGAIEDGRPNLLCGREKRLPAPYQTHVLNAGALREYIQNGDGTITDMATGLMWAKQVAFAGSTTEPSGPMDMESLFTWGQATEPWLMNGTVVTEYLDVLNDVAGGGADCFAGFCDWRLPNVKELMSLIYFHQKNNSNPPVARLFGAEPINLDIPWPTHLFQAVTPGCGSNLRAWCTSGDITTPDCNCVKNAEYMTSTTTLRDWQALNSFPADEANWAIRVNFELGHWITAIQFGNKQSGVRARAVRDAW